MLRSLAVKNFAVIEELRLEPSPGLNVFTGETGAGKSILIEALGFLLGARGSVDWLRSGAQRLEVEGSFDSRDLPEALRAAYPSDGKTAVVRRELDAGGKTRAWINGRPAPVSALAGLGEGLVDFHGQHENQTLMRSAAQLELLDAFGAEDGLKNQRIAALRPAVAEAYRRWSELGRELDALHLPEAERAKRLDLCRFQVTELEEAALRPGEEEELEALLPRLKNGGKLATLAAQARELLYEQEGSAAETLQKAEKAFEELARLDPALAEALPALAQARSSVEDALARLSGYGDSAEADPARLDEALGRLDAISRLKRKHGGSVAEALAALERLRSELAWLEDSDGRAAAAEKERGEAEAELRRLCAALHKSRMAAAARLSTLVGAELRPLGMPAARVSVSVEMEEDDLGPSGSDRVEFLIAANPGEPLKPLKSVASGGELSRVMLALKTVLARADRVPVLVFDEVDAGVGGVVGRTVGERLAGLARARQVLCVTHLPQVACWASAHFHVTKEAAKGRTRTRVETLAGERRLQAVAVMMGGREASAASLRHARELLEECSP